MQLNFAWLVMKKNQGYLLARMPVNTDKLKFMQTANLSSIDLILKFVLSFFDAFLKFYQWITFRGQK